MVGKCSRQCARAPRILGFGVAIQLVILSLGTIPTFSTDTKKCRAVHASAVAQPRISASPQPESPSKLGLELTPSQIRFEEVPVGEVSSQMVRLTNIGEELLQIYRIEVPGAEFCVTGQVLPFVIARGTSADFTISYRPKSEGHELGRVLVYAAERTEPLAVYLAAWATMPQQELVASVVNLEFLDVPLGTARAKQISVINTGNREVSVPAVTVTGSSAFGMAGPNGIKLRPGQKVEMLVTFQPTTTGLHNGVLYIAETLQIPLTAMAVMGSSSVIRLQWEGDPASGLGYTVYRSTQATGPYEQIAASLDATEFLDSGLAAGHTYYYVVTSVGLDDMAGEFSEPISATVPQG